MTEQGTNLLEKLKRFGKENPFEFNDEELERIKLDIISPQNGIVCDEYVDFILWSEGLKSRQERFADYVENKLPIAKYKNILDVGCGRMARSAMILAKRGYDVTAMDPKIEYTMLTREDICCIKDYFEWEKINLNKYDAVVAQEPCEATEHIVRACMAQQKSFIMALCGVPHVLLNGEELENVYDWYNYLLEIGQGKCKLEKPRIAGGYASYVILNV